MEGRVPSFESGRRNDEGRVSDCAILYLVCCSTASYIVSSIRVITPSAFLHQRENVRNLLQSLWDEYAVYEDDPEEIVVLPFSKKNLYHTWIREQGWLVKEENGRMAAYKDWELLPGFYETQEEANEKSGKVAGDKISYPSFFNIWKAEFSRLRVTETRTPRKKRSNYHSDDEA